MRFLRAIKPRRNGAQAARVGASAEEEEEGRQGLLPNIASISNECNIEQRVIELASLNVHGVPLMNASKLQEQAACTTQVVTLKAFIHCQGCARRVKKTLSKLQGVSTFHVDADQQKVTVIGSMGAEEVLQSMNKVLKGTQLWAAPQNTVPVPLTPISAASN
ncbi:hypothetical protein GOP47_0015496 [Adiantum capillus-veneris]|uniref:HMA domain-containing protein n=1 Tax=Adiantum capillus-veneris TaxID=13818 RepID=A0A9D4UJV6_ADICA|nr:hypothetical protein GOP47_0015496 [Adiantum capillus-veneris]